MRCHQPGCRRRRGSQNAPTPPPLARLPCMHPFAQLCVGEVFFDKEKDLFKCLGNGKLLKHNPWCARLHLDLHSMASSKVCKALLHCTALLPVALASGASFATWQGREVDAEVQLLVLRAKPSPNRISCRWLVAPRPEWLRALLALLRDARVMLNPMSSAWKRVMKANKTVQTHNLVGNGTIKASKGREAASRSPCRHCLHAAASQLLQRLVRLSEDSPAAIW